MALMSRVLARPASAFAGVDDYEAMGSPVFAWRDAVARDSTTGDALNGIATLAAWHALNGSSGPRVPASGCGPVVKRTALRGRVPARGRRAEPRSASAR